MEKSFTRADGLNFELKKSGNKTMLWEVLREGKFQRFEIWRLQQVRGGNPREYDPDEIGIHFSMAMAESAFNKNEENSN